MRSLRRYLVTVLIALFTLISFVAALQSYKQSAIRAEALFDQDLQVLASSLSQQYQAGSQQELGLALQVWQKGELVYRSALAPETSMSEAEGFSEHNFAGKRWRVFRQTPTDLLTVIVAQPLTQRQQLADEVITASIYPVVLSLPLQALLIWLVVSKALSPIKRFSAQLSSKKANDLTPVELEQVPAELDQMLKTTNQLFARLADAFDREKRFASDVAHELRTPLAVLSIHAENARNSQDPAEQAQALAAVKEFEADALVVPMGLDTFEGDPISGFTLQGSDYFTVGEALASAGLPTVFTFEGGYAVDAVGTNAVNLLEGFNRAV